MKRILISVLILGVLIGMLTVALHKNGSENTPLEKLKEQYTHKVKASVDHSLFPQLKNEIQKTSGSNGRMHLMPQWSSR